MNFESLPNVAVVITTYNRSQFIENAVETVLDNDFGPFEVHIIDQGPGDGVSEKLSRFENDPRVNYHRSYTRGASIGRNTGVNATSADIVVFTDDDCIVPKNWLQHAVKPFIENENLGLLFGKVLAGDHNSDEGFIPTYNCQKAFQVSTVQGKNKIRGIAATSAVRRSAFLAINGFDTMLGPGAPFHSNEEGDLTVRMLIHGYDVRETPDFCVTHDGFRTYQEGRKLAWHNWFGIGGAYAKYLKIGPWSAIHIYFWELFFGAMNQIVQNTFIKRRPGGVTPLIAFLAGTLKSFFTPIDRQSYIFNAPTERPADQKETPVKS